MVTRTALGCRDQVSHIQPETRGEAIYDKLGCFVTFGRFKNSLSRTRIRRKLARWATRPRYQFTTAVGTLSTENLARTGPAERTFERTNERVNTVGRQITIAAFAVRSKLQHFVLLRYLATLRDPALAISHLRAR